MKRPNQTRRDSASPASDDSRTADLVLVALALARDSGGSVEAQFGRARELLDASAEFLRSGVTSTHVATVLRNVRTPAQLAKASESLLQDAGGGHYDWPRLLALLNKSRKSRADRRAQIITIEMVRACLPAEGEADVDYNHLLDAGRLSAEQADEVERRWVEHRRKRTAAATVEKNKLR